MAGITFSMNPATARQWIFVGFWVGFGLVMGGALAACTVSMMLKGARALLGLFA